MRSSEKSSLTLISRIYSFAKKIKNHLEDHKVVSLRPTGPCCGNVLLSYLLKPFVLKSGQSVSHFHSNYSEALLIAQTFLELGYSVDVINWWNQKFIPRKEYAFFIDSRWNMERLAPLLGKNCIKIFHIDLCHMLFNNAAEASRLLALQQRRGVTLRPRRFEYPNLGIEHADYATMLGNDFTENTFRYANKPIFRVPVISPSLSFSSQGKDFHSCRKNFVWFGSGGLVRKGLDLVLECFAEMPDCHLTVCGPISDERDFEKAFYEELYESQNIRTVGWVDVHSREFHDIAQHALGLVFPSSSEGQCGGVVTCMHAGLIPIVSYESGIDVDSFGVVLKDCSIEEIKKTVRYVSSLPGEQLEGMARRACEFAQVNHSKERFAERYRQVITAILADRR